MTTNANMSRILLLIFLIGVLVLDLFYWRPL